MPQKRRIIPLNSIPFRVFMNARLSSVRRELFKIASACTIFFLLAPSASAATYFWAGNANHGNGNEWENPLNWSTSRAGFGNAGIPGAGDIAEFNTGTGTRLVTLKSSRQVGGVLMNSLWTGSLLLGTGALRVGTGGIKIGSGYFVAGTSMLSLSGSYTQTGGIVRGLQGTFSLSGSLSITTPGATAAFFTSTGTIVFSGNKTQTFTPLQRGRFTNVIIANYNKAGAHSVVVATNNMALSGSLTINRGKLDLATNSKTLTMRSLTMANHASGALVTDSNVFNSGSVTISGTSPTFTVSAGTWKQVSHSNTTLNFAGKPVYNFTLANGGATGSKTETLGGALNMSGALTITSGILDTSSSNYGMSITGAVGITGSFNANGSAITVGGNWTTEAAGGFSGGSSTVTLNGSNKTLSGSTTFYNLTKTLTANDTLNFAAGTTTSTSNRLTFSTSSYTLSLRSTVDGSRFNITPIGNRYSIGVLDVKDSNATVTISCVDCTNSGNNSAGWVFTTTTSSSTTSTGTSGGGGGGGGGGRAYLNVTGATPAVPGVSPAVPATPKPKAAVTKNMTMKERLEARRKARIDFQNRIKDRAAKRKSGR